ncbi:hypothetical protein SAMN05428969_1075 [Devosia sp. YR412]|uniref:hypothetical protein n=1 Tax=Devosia sp. YR412 TaxID=1881030 RepID=UPI0008C3526D|nr:hypothetical protein [Devosia sp. YR412]SEP82538.1 hypothetical protein SAMN05428969_1075 [Devosia sp. YR412]
MAISKIIQSLNNSALHDKRLTPHPSRTVGGTQYISIFLNRRGDAMALDLSSGSNNAIFMPFAIAPARVLPAIDRTLYAADKSRNSNVNVPELQDRALTRFHCSGLGQARDVMNYFAELT